MSVGLSNRMYNIIRTYTDHMKFAAYMAGCLSHSFNFLFHFLSMYIWLCVLCASV